MNKNNSFRIVFMGTPEFAVAPLDILLTNNFQIVGVVTAPDKPSGRGMKIHASAVKEYALKKGLKIFQPEKLKNPEFIESLKELHADLFIVVAFRMLPKSVWEIPTCGTINLHASLLPQYRGAAPINFAIINGEKETGVTTFFINEQIDTGDIIDSVKTEISAEENAGDLHDRLMNIGAQLVLDTVISIRDGNLKKTNQSVITTNEILKSAPKISKEDCRINWNENAEIIHNKIRGLSPFPGAFTELLVHENKKYLLKIFKSKTEIIAHDFSVGSIFSDEINYIKIAVKNGYVLLEELQLEGRKKMSTTEFLRGFSFDRNMKVN